ncbi:hypothetical protein Xcel_1585 [Xylanimonas cellulosilytica DSM 15894]|uniref:Uncharacterized protein n=1 Tax=Xylanimonas cellulosilytica (strain DSM 15894 / JCM 12276 / CECT 5975 / KCTC 9989 / LMG 20990 / NBRC 107835 / XIL07) TaxID=446471 RepID=D1BSC1_XYLCX|nr:hypothetical protein Xcel_1585 [Xylanimonas cellulosilytica DSM 15894]
MRVSHREDCIPASCGPVSTTAVATIQTFFAPIKVSLSMGPTRTAAIPDDE